MPLIKLNANLRSIAGKREEIIEGNTLIEVIKNLIDKHPSFGEAILEDGGVRQHFIITINGHHSTDLAQSVKEDDVIAIFPPISGG